MRIRRLALAGILVAGHLPIAALAHDRESPTFDARVRPTAVWADGLMLIWGGKHPTNRPGEWSDGGRFDPLSDTWMSVDLRHGPSAPAGHSTVYTGLEFIVWGGDNDVRTAGRNGDLDGACGGVDNCPSTSNPGQQDTRFCAPSPTDSDYLSLLRGLLSEVRTGYHLTCAGTDASGAPGCMIDVAIPPPGDGFFYLKRASNFDCGAGPLGYDGEEREIVNANPVVCDVAFSDHHAASETTVYGTVSGTYTTQSSNDAVESVTEVLSMGGSPSSRYSRLEHSRSLPLGGGAATRIEVHVEGFRGANADGDDFRFGYSAGGGPWLPLTLPSLPFSDDDMDLITTIPAGAFGTISLRVLDTDRTAGNQSLDTVSVDEIWVRTSP